MSRCSPVDLGFLRIPGAREEPVMSGVVSHTVELVLGDLHRIRKQSGQHAKTPALG